MKPKLIVLIGLDGSGKTTQAELIRNWLIAKGIPAQVVWMRGESYLTIPILKIGKALLRAPKEKKRGEGIKAREEYDKYLTAKHSLFKSGIVRTIWRTLTIFDLFISFKVAFSKLSKDVKVVILDRYVYDTLIDIDSAFGAQGTEMERLLRSPLLRMFPRPQKVILLELSPAEAMRRKDDIPSAQYLEERHDLYQRLARAIGASTVDAAQGIEEVKSEITSRIEGVLD